MPIRLPCTRRTPAGCCSRDCCFSPIRRAEVVGRRRRLLPGKGRDHCRHSPDAAAKSAAKLVRVNYQVADLVVPIPSVVQIPDARLWLMG